jgi:hypothetical protein
MQRSDKLGVTSAVCLVLALLPPYENWKQPVNTLLIFASFALAYFAGRSGRRAWFGMCLLLVALLGVAAYYAMKTL